MTDLIQDPSPCHSMTRDPPIYPTSCSDKTDMIQEPRPCHNIAFEPPTCHMSWSDMPDMIQALKPCQALHDPQTTPCFLCRHTVPNMISVPRLCHNIAFKPPTTCMLCSDKSEVFPVLDHSVWTLGQNLIYTIRSVQTYSLVDVHSAQRSFWVTCLLLWHMHCRKCWYKLELGRGMSTMPHSTYARIS